MAVQVVSYDPRWPVYFRDAASHLEDLLQDVPILSIEHVGSTSVPGLAAKPIIDIDVVVSAEYLPNVTFVFERAGYRHLGTMGVPGREAFRGMVWPEPGVGGGEEGNPSTTPSGPPLKVNLYACVPDGLGLKNHLAVREVLRTNTALRDEYAQAKRDIAVDATDVDAYCAAKSHVLNRILVASGRLNRGELEEILNDNLDYLSKPPIVGR